MYAAPLDRILVVHNNAHLLGLLTNLLTDEGYTVAGSSYSLNLATSLSNLPQLVVLDHSPSCEESCVDSLQQLALTPEFDGVRVLICSSTPGRAIQMTASLRYLPVKIVAKPFDIPTLLNQVEEMLLAPVIGTSEPTTVASPRPVPEFH